MRKILFFCLFLFTTTIMFSQSSKYDTLVLDKMIVANVLPNAKVGSSIDSKCVLQFPTEYSPIHKRTGNMTLVTDYVLCNNGSVNMFFEIYDGNSYKIVSDKDLQFNKEVDPDQIKVQLASRSKEEKDLVHNNIAMLSDFVKDYGNEEETTQLNAQMREAIQPFLATEKYGLGFIKYNAVEGYSSTGAYFKIFNPSKKTIKYIWFTVGGENAVEDLVRTSSGGFYKTLKGIGPISSYGFASWEFDYVWFTDIVEYLRISTIKIQYMDGSVRTVKYNSNMYIGEDAYDSYMELESKIPDSGDN